MSVLLLLLLVVVVVVGWGVWWLRLLNRAHDFF